MPTEARRRTWGLAAHYTLLTALAFLVLLPLLLTLILTFSPPGPYIRAGTPLHPVAVDWTDRTWFTGGVFSVAARSLVLLFVLAWMHLKAASGSRNDLRPLRQPRRIAAVLGGFVALSVLSGQVIAALVERSDATTAWFLGSMAMVAITQLLGFVGNGHSFREALAYSVLAGIGLVAAVVVGTGASVWTESWARLGLGSAMGRSFLVTALIVGCQVLTSVLSAYAFAFLRFPLKGLAFAFFMATMLLPIEVTLLANVQLIRDLRWIDTTHGLVLPFAAVAFGTFLIRQGFRGVPPEVRDAARLDGYGHVGFMWRFAVPLARPIIAAFTLVAALAAWSQYLWPQTIIDDRQAETAQIALKSGVLDPQNAHMALAAALIVSLPVIVLLFAFQRHIIRGLTAGAVK